MAKNPLIEQIPPPPISPKKQPWRRRLLKVSRIPIVGNKYLWYQDLGSSTTLTQNKSFFASQWAHTVVQEGKNAILHFNIDCVAADTTTIVLLIYIDVGAKLLIHLLLLFFVSLKRKILFLHAFNAQQCTCIAVR